MTGQASNAFRPDTGVALCSAPVSKRVLVVDNYDSFVYILVQYLGEQGAEPIVYRNDEIEVGEALGLAPDRILISPGPGRPEDAGISCDLIAASAGRIPVLGVCLGHQAIGHVFGGRIVAAPELMHGKTSEVVHDGTGVFAGLPSPLEATRYHSLVVDPEDVPSALRVTARTPDGVIMGVEPRGPRRDRRSVPPGVDPDHPRPPDGRQLPRSHPYPRPGPHQFRIDRIWQQD